MLIHGVDLIMNNFGSNYSYHLGGNYYVQTFKASPYIHFVKYDDNCSGTPVISLDEGIAITLIQFELFVSKVCEIEDVLPELSVLTPCYLTHDRVKGDEGSECEECYPKNLLQNV